MSNANENLKERVRAFWQANPCGVKFADAAPGTRRFYELVEVHRYTSEWHIPIAADFVSAQRTFRCIIVDLQMAIIAEAQ